MEERERERDRLSVSSCVIMIMRWTCLAWAKIIVQKHWFNISTRTLCTKCNISPLMCVLCTQFNHAHTERKRERERDVFVFKWRNSWRLSRVESGSFLNSCSDFRCYISRYCLDSCAEFRHLRTRPRLFCAEFYSFGTSLVFCAEYSPQFDRLHGWLSVKKQPLAVLNTASFRLVCRHRAEFCSFWGEFVLDTVPNSAPLGLICAEFWSFGANL